MSEDDLKRRWERYCEALGPIEFEEWLDLREVDYHGVYMDELDLAIMPPGITALRFKNGHIPKVISTRKISTLTRLQMPYCRVNEFRIRRTLPNLSFLNLSNNELTRLNVPDAALFTLDVSRNDLETLHMAKQRPQMMTFDVSHNPRLRALPNIDTKISILATEGCSSLPYKDSPVFVDIVL